MREKPPETMNKTANTWFTAWFDTPFYHILYKERDHTEAHAFMDTLTEYLNVPEGGRILDLACGRGRHALYLNKLGYDVTGVDLSDNSIAYAKQYENHRLRFLVHDMCEPVGQSFDAVFNLFTSFGYFEHDEDHLKTIKAIKSDLNADGFGVIDFMNSDFVKEHLVPEEEKTLKGIRFNIKRYTEGDYIMKDIAFEVNGESYFFQERVRAFNLADFETLFEQAGVYLLDIFGDYRLRHFHPKSSERLVMIFK